MTENASTKFIQIVWEHNWFKFQYDIRATVHAESILTQLLSFTHQSLSFDHLMSGYQKIPS